MKKHGKFVIKNYFLFIISHCYFFSFSFSFFLIGRRGGLMVSVHVPGACGRGLSPGRGHCVVFLGKTLNSHSASSHPGV